MFKYLYKNKKGISLMEMIIAVSLVGFVISIAGQLLANFTRTYNIATRRWEVQSAVHLACNKFEKNRDSIVNAYKADLIYDKALEQGIKYDRETHTVTKWWDNKSLVMPEESKADSTDPYTYIFSTPAYDSKTNEYLGKFLFIREYNSEYSELFLNNEGMGEVPVDISFRVATSPDRLELDQTTKQYKFSSDQKYSYLKSTVEIEFKPGLEDIPDYKVRTQFTMYNFGGRSMTMEGAYPVLESSWGDTAYPAGWRVAEDTLKEMLGNTAESTTAGETAENTEGETEENIGADSLVISGAPDKLVKKITGHNPVTYEEQPVDCSAYLSKDANLMRFISERAAAATGADATELTSSTEMASCLTKLLFIDGTREGARTVGALRDFRDNVLRGSKVGDWVIDKYYNSWSPALVAVCQESPATAKVIKAVLSPVSKVLGVISYEN